MRTRCREILLPLGLLLAAAFTPPVAGGAQLCRETIVASTPDANFTVHGDGGVLQNTTGLIWMRCSLGQTWDGRTCTGQPATFTWREALRAARDERFAGRSDWRLPNKNELESIVEDRCASPAINSAIFPETASLYYWSSSPYSGSGRAAWSVDFSFGSVNASVKSGRLNVRLVRGGP